MILKVSDYKEKLKDSMLFDPHTEEMIIKLVVSTIVGFIIGAEREYRNKSAGLRTIMLICLGSTIFTIISFENSHETEVGRIASNIVTGIGFLGAGAIMRDGLSISGLTTASAIWVAAALGMAVGAGQFQLAVMAVVLVLIVLVLFTYLQKFLDRVHKTIDLHVVFKIEYSDTDDFEAKLQKLDIRYERKKEFRRERDVKYQYELVGKAKDIDQLIQYLISKKEKIKSFEY
jgi:putative Mg2+ transporter-C (MgtC) family protein